MIMSPCIRNMALGSDFLFLTIFSQSLCLLSQPPVFRQSFRKARNQRTHCRQVPTQTLRHVFESITQPSDQHVSHQRSRSRDLPSTIRSAKHFRLHSHTARDATKHHCQLFLGPLDLFFLGFALEGFSKSRGSQKSLVFNLVILLPVPLLQTFPHKSSIPSWSVQHLQNPPWVNYFAHPALRVFLMATVTVLLDLANHPGSNRVLMNVADQDQ